MTYGLQELGFYPEFEAPLDMQHPVYRRCQFDRTPKARILDRLRSFDSVDVAETVVRYIRALRDLVTSHPG